MRRWLAGAALVTVGWLAAPQAVPVYDGIGTDNPYRYVGKSPAPTSTSETVKVGQGSADGLDLRTGEFGPQLSVSLTPGSLRLSGTSVTVTATPFAAAGPVPRGTIDGNGYRIVATPAATFDAASASGFLFLRAAVMTKPSPVMVHRATPADAWVEVSSGKVGNDIIGTPLRAFGDYAVVRLPGSKAVSLSGGLSPVRLLFLGGGVLLLVIITVLVLRRPSADEAG